MPNWCFNAIEIHGPSEDRDRFHRFLQTEMEDRKYVDSENAPDLSPLSAFVPMPDYYKTQAGFNDGGYDWCVKNWGTKWPECGFVVESNVEYDLITFDTAWSPPCEGYKAISSFFDKLTFCHVWSELGMYVAGFGVYRRGMNLSIQEVDEQFMPSMDDDDNFDAAYADLHETLMNQARCFIPRIAKIGE